MRPAMAPGRTMLGNSIGRVLDKRAFRINYAIGGTGKINSVAEDLSII